MRKVKLKGSFGYSENGMVEFKIHRILKRAHNRLITLDFRRTDFGLFMVLLGRILQDRALKRRGDKKRWLIFKIKSDSS